MENVKDKESLFTRELAIFNQAKANLQDEKYQDNRLLSHYRELVDNYEKLLKMTIKIFKISDIQGKSLKSHEQEFERINRDLQQMDQSRRQLLADISHELGTPMTSIQGYIKGMLDGVIDRETKYLQLVYDKLLLVDRLVEDLFELAKLEANQIKFHFQPIAVNELWEIISHRFRFEIESNGYQLLVDPINSLAAGKVKVMVEIDLVRIEQVINNLFGNAMKNTPPGGSIRLHSELSDKNIFIKISDTGAGIAQGELNRVFDRFYRGTEALNQQAGTGLGLAIAKEIVGKHGGEIAVESTWGQGSTFYFSLPVKVKEQQKKKPRGKR